MNDCSKHKKEVAGITSMIELADMVGDLHYETLTAFLTALSVKIGCDGEKDWSAGRVHLGASLEQAAYHIKAASQHIQSAWNISKPFMDKIKTNNND